MTSRRSQIPYWGIPAAYAVVAVVAGLTLPRLEHHFLPRLQSGISPAAALAILSSVGSGMIALTGIVFALAFVMVQFSATAYSPRLVLWLSRDPVVWHSVGIFSATFLYSLAAIAWIDRPGSGGVPLLSSWLVIALLLLSVGMFIALIQRISLLQIQRMLGFTADHGRRVIDQMYPALEAAASTVNPAELETRPLRYLLQHTGSPQTFQGLDVRALLALSSASGAVVVLDSAVGDTLVEGTVMARVLGGNGALDKGALRHAFLLGDERTFDQDPKYAIRLLVDIAIRALSPAVNDPTTAVQALDQIEDLLRRLGRRRLEVQGLRDRSGSLRVTVQLPTWDDFLTLAFDEIRFYGATSVQVMRRMKALVADLIEDLPPERRPSLRYWKRRLDETIAKSFGSEEEKQEASVEDRQGLGIPRTHLARER